MLKVGVFGVGHLGKFHINNWKEIPGIKLIGFFDPNNDNAKEVSEKYGLKRYMDEEKLIDSCDIIDVITPTTQHFEICMQAIRKGKHVFVEKPITNTIQGRFAHMRMSGETMVSTASADEANISVLLL